MCKNVCLEACVRARVCREYRTNTKDYRKSVAVNLWSHILHKEWGKASPNQFSIPKIHRNYI